MRIVAGTYEGFCYGWESNPENAAGAAAAATLDTSATEESTGSQASLSPTSASPPQPLSLVFGYNVHVGCLKSVAMATSGTLAGQLLVTGGADERVRIYDLRSRTELGELQQHNGTITCMEFYKSTHLLTGSEDHTICIWRVHDWALLHVLGGHKAAVTSLSIHPSGRMALSVSQDRTLRLWNLLEGRCAYIKRLQGEGELVRWSPAGGRYLVVVGSTVVVYGASTSDAVGECTHDVRVNSVCFLGHDGGAVVTCADDKTIRFFRAEGGTLLGRKNVSDVCPTGRIRAMCHVEGADGGDGEGGAGGAALVTVTSAGGVHVWGIPSLGGVGAEGAGTGAELAVPLLATQSLKGEPRFTCVSACLSGGIMAPAPGQSKGSNKRRRCQPEQAAGGVESESDRQGEDAVHADSVAGQRSSSSDKKQKKKSKHKRAKEVKVQTAADAVVDRRAESGKTKGGASKQGWFKRHNKAKEWCLDVRLERGMRSYVQM